MGAFFLYNTKQPIRLNAVEELFRAKGFDSPAVFDFGIWRFLYYRKQLMSQELFSATQGETSLFAFGTFSYRGQGLRKSLETILSDHLHGKLDRDTLLGCYCLLFCNKTDISILTDRMNLFHVFVNDDVTVISSSFAAVLKAGLNKYRLNFAAAIENILTGYIIGPETIVRGISLADVRYRKSFCCEGVKFMALSSCGQISEPLRFVKFDECVDEQLAELDQYFYSFRNIVDEVGGVDIGLSGGYDSRLLILLAKKHFAKLYAHTHFHHKTTSDETSAGAIAVALNVPLNCCAAVKQPEDMDVEEFERNLANTAAYNDGRVIHDYSWMSYFRTRWYRESVLRGLRFGMNGLAGELYRNHDNHVYQKVEVREWVKARVMNAHVAGAVDSKTLNNTLDYILGKASATLGLNLSRQISRHETRRYFGELFSVYGAAVRMNIDNQIALSLSPFLDYGPRMSSYRVLPHIGWDGRFEAAMISRMDPSVAAIISSYGYGFDRPVPARQLLKCAMRGVIPCRAQNIIQNLMRKKNGVYMSVHEHICQRQPLVQRAVELLQGRDFGLIRDFAAQDHIMAKRAVSVGIMLLKYDDCIDL